MKNNSNHSYLPGSDTRVGSPASVDLETAFEYIRALARGRHFGVIQLSMQSGNLMCVRTEQSFKAADLKNLMASSQGVSNGARNSQ
jgi:hypothetical protein